MTHRRSPRCPGPRGQEPSFNRALIGTAPSQAHETRQAESYLVEQALPGRPCTACPRRSHARVGPQLHPKVCRSHGKHAKAPTGRRRRPGGRRGCEAVGRVTAARMVHVHTCGSRPAGRDWVQGCFWERMGEKRCKWDETNTPRPSWLLFCPGLPLGTIAAVRPAKTPGTVCQRLSAAIEQRLTTYRGEGGPAQPGTHTLSAGFVLFPCFEIGRATFPYRRRLRAQILTARPRFCSGRQRLCLYSSPLLGWVRGGGGAPEALYAMVGWSKFAAGIKATLGAHEKETPCLRLAAPFVGSRHQHCLKL